MKLITLIFALMASTYTLASLDESLGPKYIYLKAQSIKKISLVCNNNENSVLQLKLSQEKAKAPNYQEQYKYIEYNGDCKTAAKYSRSLVKQLHHNKYAVVLVDKQKDGLKSTLEQKINLLQAY